MPDRSKKRKRNKNKRKNNNNPQNGQNSKVAGVSSDAGSGNESVTSEVNDNSVLTKNNGDQLRVDVKPNVDEVNNIKPEIEKCDTKVKDQISEGIIKFSGNFSRGLATATYIVESPEQLKQSEKTKLSEIPKSKSLDNEDVPKIVEVTEEVETRSDDEAAVALLDCTAIVSEAESDVEWEVADDLISESLTCESATAVGLSVDTLPLNIAECEHTQALSPEEELSLRQYLQTLNLVTCPQEVAAIEVEDIAVKQRKKGVTDDTCKSKPLVSRFLDVIDEEGSNESSITSRRQSYLKDDFEDLEDDVFNKKQAKAETLDTFPLPKSVKINTNNKNARLIPQECLLVGAKIVQPKLEEGRGEWTVQNVAKMTGAEVVYLTDSSSSASDIYDVGEDSEHAEDTDSSVRIMTPVIEINNEQKLLTENKTNESNLRKIKGNNVLKTPPSSPQIFVSDANRLEEYNHDLPKSITTTGNKEIEVISNENKSPSLFVLHIDEDQILEKGKIDDGNINDMTSSQNDTQTKGLCPYSQYVVKNTVSDNKTENENVKNNEPHFKIQEPKRLIDNEINDLKLELNNALSSLIKEVAAEIDNANASTKENPLTRQDSSSSIGSSQCTAKYNPTTSSLTDIAALVHDDTTCPIKPETHNIVNKESHVKDVFERVSGSALEENKTNSSKKHQPKLLKDLCVRNIVSLPYGERILEELASVSEKLQNINIYSFTNTNSEKMPFYPLPDISVIKKVALPTKHYNVPFGQTKSSPPPIAPRNSSLKISNDEQSWTGLQTKIDPSLYVCLSPSQKMLMEKTHTVIDKEDANELIDIHQKFIDRRGYKEFYVEGKSEIEKDDTIGVIPFKSQTGNRLLAIIRDPCINNKINTKLSKWNQFNETSKKEETDYSRLKRENNNKCHDSYPTKDFRSEMNFRPIPPPRPRKYSSAIYESDESSDFTDHSFQSVSEKKYFHYSTGNLNEEIEKDVLSIQDMHRKHTSARANFKERFLKAIDEPRRRPSLPKDICEQQMEYIRQKEKEVEAEISRLESAKTNESTFQRRGPRAPLYSESDVSEEQRFNANNYHISRKRDMALHSDSNGNGSKHISTSFKSSQEEILREKMYSEYMCQMAEREERKQHKVIKITTKPLTNDSKTVSASLPVLNYFNEMRTPNNRIEEEFISKAQERWDKLGIKDPETEDERDKREEYREPKVIEHRIKVIEGGEEKDVQRLPSHLREFVKFTAGDASAASGGSPGESEVTAGPGASLFVVFCAVIVVMLAIGKRMIPFFRDNNA